MFSVLVHLRTVRAPQASSAVLAQRFAWLVSDHPFVASHFVDRAQASATKLSDRWSSVRLVASHFSVPRVWRIHVGSPSVCNGMGSDAWFDTSFILATDSRILREAARRS